MDNTTQPTLQQLLEQQLVLVNKFIEHVQLASSLMDDERLKVVLSHILEEEEEHKQDINNLISQANGLSTAVAPVASASAESGFTAEQRSTGHYERRDQNILTVGSLMGMPQ